MHCLLLFPKCVKRFVKCCREEKWIPKFHKPRLKQPQSCCHAANAFAKSSSTARRITSPCVHFMATLERTCGKRAQGALAQLNVSKFCAGCARDGPGADVTQNTSPPPSQPVAGLNIRWALFSNVPRESEPNFQKNSDTFGDIRNEALRLCRQNPVSSPLGILSNMKLVSFPVNPFPVPTPPPPPTKIPTPSPQRVISILQNVWTRVSKWVVRSPLVSPCFAGTYFQTFMACCRWFHRSGWHHACQIQFLFHGRKGSSRKSVLTPIETFLNPQNPEFWHQI